MSGWHSGDRSACVVIRVSFIVLKDGSERESLLGFLSIRRRRRIAVHKVRVANFVKERMFKGSSSSDALRRIVLEHILSEGIHKRMR